MAEVINLRQARKAKARVVREAEANANRAAFGRSKPEKASMKVEADRAASLLDGAKRDPQRDDR